MHFPPQRGARVLPRPWRQQERSRPGWFQPVPCRMTRGLPPAPCSQRAPGPTWGQQTCTMDSGRRAFQAAGMPVPVCERGGHTPRPEQESQGWRNGWSCACRGRRPGAIPRQHRCSASRDPEGMGVARGPKGEAPANGQVPCPRGEAAPPGRGVSPSDLSGCRWVRTWD